ncbi:helix-turn-helix domain-containing protein [uncultured Alsobacter sp.]|uniref:GAF domain-containing protein n=1 Tax=uncultured Alsobacter sp. TaxID=1748258 RepID=UPI0025F6609B|nr:helix-turn-helix domain-containing protein [uncultured Alsobacter sp.]
MARMQTAHHADRIHSAIRSGEAASSALVASWQRSSRLHRLDPTERRSPQRLEQARLEAARDQSAPLLRAARPSLDRLYQAVGGMGCCVLFADRDGVPLERRGAAADDETFEDWGLWPGTLWSEDSEGTNGIGTCLVEQRALTIHRHQHFFTRNTLLSCTTAPVWDHEGRLAGALDVSSCRADQTEDVTNLVALAVAEAARRIEAETFRLAFAGSRIVLACGAEWSPNGLLAADKDDIVVGATRAARQAFKGRGNLVGTPLALADGRDDENRYSDEVRHAEKVILERALSRARGNVSAAARQLGVSRATLHRKMSKLALDRRG